MDIFGGKWADYTQKLEDNWRGSVTDTDTVIIPGDFSWGMNLNEAKEDFLFLESLPGKKIISKGNHDYWWETMKKLTEFLDDNGLATISFLHNNAYLCEDIIVCGTRGWLLDSETPEDEKIVNREAQRLKTSFEAGLKLQKDSPESEIVCFLHYPPAYGYDRNLPICDLLGGYKIKRCFYGHLHTITKDRLLPRIGQTDLFLVSSDYINFTPYLING